MTATDLASAFEPYDFAEPYSAAALSQGAAAPRSEAAAAAYAQGYEDGEQAAAAAGAAHVAAALGTISDALATLESGLDSLRAEARSDAARLAFAFARKLAGRLIAEDPAAPVLDAFASLAFDLANRADITIRLHPDALAGVAAALAPAQDGDWPVPRLLADDTLPPGDCRIDWPDGGLICDHAAIEARLDALLDRHLASQITPETPP